MKKPGEKQRTHITYAQLCSLFKTANIETECSSVVTWDQDKQRLWLNY